MKNLAFYTFISCVQAVINIIIALDLPPSTTANFYLRIFLFVGHVERVLVNLEGNISIKMSSDFVGL